MKHEIFSIQREWKISDELTCELQTDDTLGAISIVCHILQCARFNKPYIPTYLSSLNKIVTFIITAQHTLFDT
nr:hypothetical protein [uncultured Duncaniella sp.]